MTDEELHQKLTAQRHNLSSGKMRQDGVFLYEVDHVLMFRADAVEIASGGATLEDIVKRNEGKIFPEAPSR
ncbi:MAG: hypothetical protein ACKV22_29775 [Bryobacteraceae bacterium]